MAKMHQIRFRLGLRTRLRWGAHSAPPGSLAGFKGPTSKGEEGRGREGRKGPKAREKEPPFQNVCVRDGVYMVLYLSFLFIWNSTENRVKKFLKNIKKF